MTGPAPDAAPLGYSAADGPNRWPDDVASVVVIKNPTCLAWEAISIYTARFLEVPPGRYEVTVVHNNERLDEITRFLLGMVTVR